MVLQGSALFKPQKDASQPANLSYLRLITTTTTIVTIVIFISANKLSSSLFSQQVAGSDSSGCICPWQDSSAGRWGSQTN